MGAGAAAAAGALSPSLGCLPVREEADGRFPVGFVSHGSPRLALDPVAGADLGRWGEGVGRPRAILVISAHWERTPLRVGTPRTRPVIHDFSGFGEELGRMEYAAPGAPELARRVADLLGVASQEERGWDHGVWVPLVHLAPRADVPVLQIALPSQLPPAELFAVGQQLAPLRDEGVWILASGGMVHNLRRLGESGPGGAPPSWASEFDDWAVEALGRGDVDTLLDFRAQAPALALAHPTLEHFLPLLVALGAARADEPVSFPVRGFELGSLARTSVQFG